MAGSANLELISGRLRFRPEDTVWEAMLNGWRSQQQARNLKKGTYEPREKLVRAFQTYTNEYPWLWTPAHMDEWSANLTSEKGLAPSTVRGYQGTVRLFSEYLIDPRYDWALACEEQFGTYPVAICHEWNTIPHLQDYEGDPEARPFTREDLQMFLDFADDQVERAQRSGRKGTLAAYRDATFVQGHLRVGASPYRDVEAGPGGLRQEPEGAAVRPVRDAQRPLRQGEEGPAAAPTERVVRHGLGRRVGRDYVVNVRPRLGFPDQPALWITERGGQLRPGSINDRFEEYRDALGLPKELTPHSLRHSYITHQTEDGVDRMFIQQQVGHECDSSLAIYTHVSNDFMNTSLQNALAPAFAGV
ncbi:tyrosine-type recombinase/integrase [Streptomyces sp. ID05-47C]|uniref:tyrosine-type recombinase/integrase n=1 Tax=Streptomyces sp. ID05-47C TaxID=3028665 RepID=UPI0029C0E7B0|nr:tyrosine-type recombinase/integrase [Streptomyces sp. ID05-47C]